MTFDQDGWLDHYGLGDTLYILVRLDGQLLVYGAFRSIDRSIAMCSIALDTND